MNLELRAIWWPQTARVQLWDSEAQTIYLKSADASGMPSIKTLDYTIRDMRPANAPVSPANQRVDYVTRGRGRSYTGGSMARGSDSYARGRGRNARRDSMGRYSREGDNEQYVQQLEEMMQELPQGARQHIQKAIQEMEQM